VREEEELNQSSVNRSVIRNNDNEHDLDQNERLLSNRSLIEDDDIENPYGNEQLVD